MKRLLLLGAPLLLALAGCGTTTSLSVSGTPLAAQQLEKPALAPAVIDTPLPTVIDASYVANELSNIEVAIRQPATPDTDYALLGQREQRAYHLLAAHPDWVPSVLNAVPASVRSAVQDNLNAGQQIGDLNGVSTAVPHWKIIAPPEPSVLLGYYKEAQQTYGVPWQYLAAINLIETNMGRIQGLSSAGAQGPMQFMPSTWAYYGRGDVNNPHDAILAAGRYLQAHGAPTNMTRAIYAYNPSMLYVRAVQLYAQQMFGEARTFLAYYNWQVFVPTPSGDMWLPEGFSN